MKRYSIKKKNTKQTSTILFQSYLVSWDKEANLSRSFYNQNWRTIKTYYVVSDTSTLLIITEHSSCEHILILLQLKNAAHHILYIV